jgi:hypothetical protein
MSIHEPRAELRARLVDSASVMPSRDSAIELAQDRFLDGGERLSLRHGGAQLIEERLCRGHQGTADGRGQPGVHQRAVEPRAPLRPRHPPADQRLRPAAPLRTASATSNGKNPASPKAGAWNAAFQ